MLSSEIKTRKYEEYEWDPAMVVQKYTSLEFKISALVDLLNVFEMVIW